MIDSSYEKNLQYTAEVSNERNQADVIYTDFSKAFDRSDHDSLIMKLYPFGMSLVFLVSIVRIILQYIPVYATP